MTWIPSEVTKSVSLIEVVCGHCQAINWLAAVWSEDPSQVDDDGMVCWSCEQESYFHPYVYSIDTGVPEENEGLVLGDGEKSILDANYIKGMKIGFREITDEHKHLGNWEAQIIGFPQARCYGNSHSEAVGKLILTFRKEYPGNIEFCDSSEIQDQRVS